MSGATELILVVAGMHVLALAGAGALIIVALRDGPDQPPGPSTESDGGGGVRPLSPRSPAGPRDGLPMPDARPARVRLREPGRLADRLPRPARRRVAEPERAPVRPRTG